MEYKNFSFQLIAIPHILGEKMIYNNKMDELEDLKNKLKVRQRIERYFEKEQKRRRERTEKERSAEFDWLVFKWFFWLFVWAFWMVGNIGILSYYGIGDPLPPEVIELLNRIKT